MVTFWSTVDLRNLRCPRRDIKSERESPLLPRAIRNLNFALTTYPYCCEYHYFSERCKFGIFYNLNRWPLSDETTRNTQASV